jgi:hypothetical protein
MKSAMQELIDELKLIEAYPMLPLVLKMATELLEKEKEQIKKANLDGYKEGCTYHSFDHRPITSEQYYNQTYNQNES